MRSTSLIIPVVVGLLGCHHPSPPIPAGTVLVAWSRPADATYKAVQDQGPDATVERELVLTPRSGKPIHLKLRLVHGEAQVTYRDNSTATRQVPRKLVLKLDGEAPQGLRASCDTGANRTAVLSGPLEAKPSVLWTMCSVSLSVEEYFPFRVEGDGTVSPIDTAHPERFRVVSGS